MADRAVGYEVCPQPVHAGKKQPQDTAARAFDPGPTTKTTKPQHGHRIFRYLLRGFAVVRPNEWCDVNGLVRSVGSDRPTKS